mgnify:CR=1 FL=1
MHWNSQCPDKLRVKDAIPNILQNTAAVCYRLPLLTGSEIQRISFLFGLRPVPSSGAYG